MPDHGVARSAEVQARFPVTGPRLAEAAGLLAVAADMATGMPLTMSLRVCLAAQRIAELIDDDTLDRSALYYYTLVRLLGCTVETSRFAGAMGNEIEISKVMVPVDQGSPREMLSMMLRTVGAGERPLRRTRMVMAALSFGTDMRTLMAGHCEVSRMLTEDLRLGGDVALALDHTYERWDGKGAPKGVRGEAIPLISRVMQAAFQAVVQGSAGGVDRMRAVARKRAGGGLDPSLAALVESHARDILEATQIASPWDAVLDAEPGGARPLSPEQIDSTATALASFADLKADHLAGHSSGVARLAHAAGKARGLPEPELTELRRAALIHDLGRVGVTSLIWDKAGALTDDEWDEVRLHAYHSERVAGRAPWLARAARMAGMHHERLDGSGYHRGCGPAELNASARLLAAADCYRALTETRPYRPALAPGRAAEVVRDEVAAGRLDGDAARCVLEAAGHVVPSSRRDLPAGLTERELEILRVIATGSTIKQAARQLSVSPKTVDAHVQHIYAKVGCTTRAGAAVFAMQRGLLEPLIRV
jgi:HD-GYP domain-containing protein (c-di-GMP phosphodiesterase class II)